MGSSIIWRTLIYIKTENISVLGTTENISVLDTPITDLTVKRYSGTVNQNCKQCSLTSSNAIQNGINEHGLCNK